MVTPMQKTILAVLIYVQVWSLGCFPSPMYEVDIPDVYSAVLPKHDPQYFKHSSKKHSKLPAMSTFTANVRNSLKLNDLTSVETMESTDDVDLQQALHELNSLATFLDIDTQYIQNRRKEHDSQSATDTDEVSSDETENDEKAYFKEDVFHAITALVAMKKMENRLIAVNKLVGKSLTANSELQDLFPKTTDVDLVQGLLELKYFEGVLHSVNNMIEDNGTYNLTSMLFDFSNSAAFSVEEVEAPVLIEEDDITISILTFFMLFFTAVGFFFVLFLIVYMLIKVVGVCFEKREDFHKRSKYQQI